MNPRDTIKKYHAPGLWEDMEGNFHWSLPDILKEYEIPDTQENREWLTKLLQNMAHDNQPNAKIIYRPTPPPNWNPNQ